MKKEKAKKTHDGNGVVRDISINEESPTAPTAPSTLKDPRPIL